MTALLHSRRRSGALIGTLGLIAVFLAGCGGADNGNHGGPSDGDGNL